MFLFIQLLWFLFFFLPPRSIYMINESRTRGEMTSVSDWPRDCSFLEKVNTERKHKECKIVWSVRLLYKCTECFSSSSCSFFQAKQGHPWAGRKIQLPVEFQSKVMRILCSKMRSTVTYCGITEIATVFDPEVCLCVFVCNPPSSPHLLKYKIKNLKAKEQRKSNFKKKTHFDKTCEGVCFFFLSSTPCLADCKHTSDN